MAQPSSSATGHARGLSRPLITTVAVVVALTLAIVASCRGRAEPELPSVAERLAESSIVGREVLRIGVYADSPLMSIRDGDGSFRGFEVEIARGVAEFLGFREEHIRWVPIAVADRMTVLQRGEVDIVVASFTMTEERKKAVRFAGPYLVTTQEVLVPTPSADSIRTIGDLRGSKRRVCIAGDSVSANRLIREGIAVETVSTLGDCTAGLLNGRFAAMSADETVLAGIRSQHPGKLSLVNLPFDTAELLGIAVPLHDPALQDLIGHYLQRNYEDSRKGRSTAWQAAYSTNLGPWLGPANQPPPLDVPVLRDHADWDPA